MIIETNKTQIGSHIIHVHRNILNMSHGTSKYNELYKSVTLNTPNLN